MERAGHLFGKLKLSPLADAETRARAAWAMAAGKIIARHTRATALVRDSLIVEVEDYVWQQQLVPLEHFLIRNLRKALGEGLVKKIDFRPMPRKMMPQRAETARPAEDGIGDPVLGLLYRQSKLK
jgi:hypothetical protein